MEDDRIRRVVGLLRAAEKPVRVLRGLSWKAEVAERFFARGEKELPEVVYERIDAEPALEKVGEARRLLDEVGPGSNGAGPVWRWLDRACDSIEHGARMMAAAGTPRFFEHSRAVYGAPTDPLADGKTTSLDLARRLEEILGPLTAVELGVEEAPPITSEDLARSMERIVKERMGQRAPRIEVVGELSSNAIAGPKQIRIRRGATFSRYDVAQLVHHEAFVHVVTSLNGHEQDDLPILAAAHPGTTRTQEGLAVFAEMVSGAMDPHRLRRLADRVLAIQMAVEGADFLDLYRFFLERTADRSQAFENARRVVRGGVLRGGAPFTKDGVYLDGLLRVHNFLRCAVDLGRVDCIRLLFAGKLDLEDIPALAVLADRGLCRMPPLLPPWAADPRFLVSYMAYSAFLNRVDLASVRAHHAALLEEAPRLRFGPSHW